MTTKFFSADINKRYENVYTDVIRHIILFTFLCVFQCITSAAVYYADLTHQKLQDTGYYEDTAPFKISDEVCL
jgi:hypothetical protein